MHGWISGKEYDRDLSSLQKKFLCLFNSGSQGLFQRKKKLVGEVTACKSENYLRIPEYTKDNVVLTSLQT